MQTNNVPSEMILKILHHLHSGDLARINIANAELASLDKEVALLQIKPLLSDPSPEMRCNAVELIFKLDVNSAMNYVTSLFYDQVDFVRICVCDEFLQSGCKDLRAIEHFSQLLSSDKNVNVRVLSALALGKISDPKAIEVLKYSLAHDYEQDSEGETVSNVAAKALKWIRVK